jgi:hypothetical protein
VCDTGEGIILKWMLYETGFREVKNKICCRVVVNAAMNFPFSYKGGSRPSGPQELYRMALVTDLPTLKRTSPSQSVICGPSFKVDGAILPTAPILWEC